MRQPGISSSSQREADSTYLSISGLHSRKSGHTCSPPRRISSSSFPPFVRVAASPLPLLSVPQDGSDRPQSSEPVCCDVVVGVLVGAVGSARSGRGSRVGDGRCTHWSSSERMRYALEISFSLAPLVMFKNESAASWGQQELGRRGTRDPLTEVGPSSLCDLETRDDVEDLTAESHAVSWVVCAVVPWSDSLVFVCPPERAGRVMRDGVSSSPSELRLRRGGTYVPERTATAAQVTRRGETFILSNLVRNKKRHSCLPLLPPTITSPLHDTVRRSSGNISATLANPCPGQSSRRRLHLFRAPAGSPRYRYSGECREAARAAMDESASWNGRLDAIHADPQSEGALVDFIPLLPPPSTRSPLVSIPPQ